MWSALRAFGERILRLRRRWQGLIFGCVLWLVWMIFGFWSTLLLLVLAALGYLGGRVFEERHDWRAIVERLLADRYHDS